MIKLEKRKLDSIFPYKNNPRNNDGKATEAVIESIRQCGYVQPIIVDEDGVILAGHTRYKALQAMNIDEADVVVREGLTEDQKKKYRILDNRTNELAYWNYDLLMQELEGIDFEGYAFGFEKLTQKIEQSFDDGFEYDVEEFSDETFKHECPECGFKFN